MKCLQDKIKEKENVKRRKEKRKQKEKKREKKKEEDQGKVWRNQLNGLKDMYLRIVRMTRLTVPRCLMVVVG